MCVGMAVATRAAAQCLLPQLLQPQDHRIGTVAELAVAYKAEGRGKEVLTILVILVAVFLVVTQLQRLEAEGVVRREA